MADATLKQVAEFFGYAQLSKFRDDWNNLSDTDRAQIKAGIGDGSLTY